MQSLGRRLWGDVWAWMYILLGMTLASFVTASVYSNVFNFWIGTVDLYILIGVTLAKKSKLTANQATIFCIVASTVTLAIYLGY